MSDLLASTGYDISVIAPARNEQGNSARLTQEILEAFDSANTTCQIIIIDDGSTDGTPDELASLAATHQNFITRRHPVGQGQSAALFTAIQLAKAPLIATLDADLQNDPADLPAMVRLLRQENADLVQGDRTANRCDHVARRAASVVGCIARHLIVGDRVRDTGCGTRVMRAEFARRLPLDRPGMHRFIPACIVGLGGHVIETPVNHRPRQNGTTKYGTGLFTRGLPGLRDCFTVRAMIRQARREHGFAPATTPSAA